MSNFGFHHLRVVNPYDVAFEGARSAVDAARVLASAEKYENLAEAVSDFLLVVRTTANGHRDLQHCPQPLNVGAPANPSHAASCLLAIPFPLAKYGPSE